MNISLQTIPDDVQQDLEGRANVTGTGIGPKQTDREGITDEESIVVFVSEKKDESELDDDDVVPQHVTVDDKEFRTDVQEVGDVKMLEMQETGSDLPMDIGLDVEVTEVPETMSRKGAWRPAPAGVSVGHPEITAGTLGTPPLRADDDSLVFLTNSHVAAMAGDASVGDDVIQPGSFDGGSAPDDLIGTLKEFTDISTTDDNRSDSALVEVAPDHLQTDIFEVREDLRGFEAAEIDRTHKKSGRTTDVTLGKCVARHANFNIRFDDGTARFVDLDVYQPMAAGGDSGSLIGYEQEDGFYGTSLLFAGSPSVTLGIPMSAVEAEHGNLRPTTSQDLADPDDLRITDTAFDVSLEGGESKYRWSGPWGDRYVIDFEGQPAQNKGFVRTSVEGVYRTQRGLYYLVEVGNRRSNQAVDCTVKYVVHR
jgi:hypothetical protein